MSLTRKIAHNTIIQIVGKAAGVGFGIATVGLMTRYLGQTGFGYYTTIFAFIQIFAILFDFGLQMTTVSMISDPKYDESNILSNILGLRLILALFVLIIAPIISLFFPYPAIVKFGIFIISFTFLFSSLTSILTGVFQKYLVTQKVALVEFIHKVLTFFLVFLAIYLKQGLLTIIIFTVLTGLIHFLLLQYYAKKITPFCFRFEFEKWKKIILKTWPIALTIALNLVYFKADTIILSIFKSQADVGIYGAPYRLLEVLINFAYLFLGLLLPLMTTYYAAKNIDKLKIILQKGFNVLIIFTVPMIFGTYFLGVPAMVLVAGKEFAISGELLKILMLATGSIFIAALFGYVVVAIGKQKQMIKFYLANAIISLAAYLFLIPIYSYWAAAWLTVFTEMFVLITAYWVVYKNIKFVPDLKIFYKSIIASLAMCLPLYYLPALNIFISLSLAMIIYFGAMYLIRGISKNLLIEILKKK